MTLSTTAAQASCRFANYKGLLAAGERLQEPPPTDENPEHQPCGVQLRQDDAEIVHHAQVVLQERNHIEFTDEPDDIEPPDLDGSTTKDPGDAKSVGTVAGRLHCTSCGEEKLKENDHECRAGDACEARHVSPRSSLRRDSFKPTSRSGTAGSVYTYSSGSPARDLKTLSHEAKVELWKSELDLEEEYEEKLLGCVVNTDHIRPAYKDIHIDREIINQLEGVTTMSLKKQKAYGHGILRNNRVTGAVLWGPPGTGKSLLARGMSKESGFNMLAVSIAEIWQSCWGEDEKVIKAVFSLARKLYPCIVFLDEADAMFGARKAGEKRHIRGMLNQFLMEWDGIMTGDNAPFVLLATNRPFDLDPAVLRRAPVQIHLNIPSLENRQGILELLLEEEILDSTVNPAMLAKMTPSYTGSDLKSMCVIAAINCVREQQEDTAQRVLARRHFTTAMESIRPTRLNKTLNSEFQNFKNRRQTASSDN